MTTFTYRPRTPEEFDKMQADFDHWISLGYLLKLRRWDANRACFSVTVCYGEWGHCPECDSDDIEMETIDDECGPEFMYCNACGAPYHESSGGVQL